MRGFGEWREENPPHGFTYREQAIWKRSESVRVQQLGEVVRLADGLIPCFHRRKYPENGYFPRRTGFGQLETELTARDRVNGFLHPLRDRLGFPSICRAKERAGGGGVGDVRPQIRIFYTGSGEHLKGRRSGMREVDKRVVNAQRGDFCFVATVACSQCWILRGRGYT